MVTTETHICSVCNNVGLERTHFFPRQLVTAPDLTQDQNYFREKLRRHNRLLHGWGVVCGARCKTGPGECEVVIEPGYILGPFGDEILIDREVTVDVCKQDLDGNVAGPCGQPADPWCSNVRVDRAGSDKLYIAVSYAECQDRPVRVISGGCGCEQEACEYSRIPAVSALSKRALGDLGGCDFKERRKRRFHRLFCSPSLCRLPCGFLFYLQSIASAVGPDR